MFDSFIKEHCFCINYYFSQTLVTLTTKLISTLICLTRIIPNQRPNLKLSICLKQSWTILLCLLRRVSIPCVIVVISSSLLWSWWIPPSFFKDETAPRTLCCTPELPWRRKKKEKEKEKNSKKDWHVTLAKKEFRCCSWLWIWLRVCLFHYIFLLCFFHQKQNLQAQIDKKELFYSLKNDNLKHETIFVFVKFTNCDNWIFSPESPVAKYVHFQASSLPAIAVVHPVDGAMILF